MKIKKTAVSLFFILTPLIATQSCGILGGSDYKTLSPTDLATLADSLTDSQKRALSQNEGQRKQLIESFKNTFSLAQAAEAEGMQKTEKFKRIFGLTIDSYLATEHRKRNPTVTFSKEELDAYYTAHKAECEADFKSYFDDQPDQPQMTGEQQEKQKEAFRTQWENLKLRSDKARQGGMEKDKLFAMQAKFSRAKLLADQYTETLEKRLALTPEEKAKYIAEHPEADPEKVKQKAEGVLERVKKGESFEKIADEINEDGTKGRGGDLDWFTKEKMVPEFANAAFALKKGQTTSELVKTRFGYHIIRVDDKREVKPKAAALTPGAEAGKSNETVEEVHARHILISTREVDSFEKRLTQEKVKKAFDEIAVKYPVKAPADFLVTVPDKAPGK